MPRQVQRSFEHTFRGPLPEVWTAMADTARYNEASGLPRHQVQEVLGADGSVRFLAQARMGPFDLAWEDLPCNWVKEQWFEHLRRFSKGPLATLSARLDLRPVGEGCHGRYTLLVEPRGLAGQALMAGGFMRGAGRAFDRLAAEADTFAIGQRDHPFIVPPPQIEPAARERARRLAAELRTSPYTHGLDERLLAMLIEGAELDLARIRPLLLARQWQVPERFAIEACLQATRTGLLALRWDLLCPRCRGAKAGAGTLDTLPQGAHCGTCNIDFGRDFSRNVELSFRPAEWLRPISGGEFCLLGPMSTPHIWAHVTLEPGESREVPASLPPGPYRLRTLEPGVEADVEHDGSGFPAALLTDCGMEAGAPPAQGLLRLRNETGSRRTFVVEERAWVRDALTADRVTTLQAFRDLFSDQVLRPGDEVGVARITLLFSDLRGSTALYDAVGDAQAYGLVREHFAYLAGIVRAHDGCIVKTIGDAVMASFIDPLRAVQAALAMQQDITLLNARLAQPLTLKVGLHEGPGIGVTLNDRLDYFGSTVNLAARLQQQSRGGDIVVSRVLAEDPAVQAILAPLAARPEAATLKGFAKPVEFYRLSFADAASGVKTGLASAG